MLENLILDEALKFALDNGIIDSNTILRKYEMAKRKEILEKHPCQIWQGKNGYYYTHIYKDGQRRLIKKKDRSQVEEAIIELYKDEPSVNEVFNRWIAEKKAYREISDATCDRYVADFHRFFDDTKLKKRKINGVTPEEIEQHIRDNIIQHDLTSKAYGNLRTVIIGIWSYAYKYKYSNIQIRTFFSELRLSSKMFKHKSKLAEDNVFTEDEIKRITKHLMNNRPNVISYGIILAMRTGLRVGELVSLTYEDVTDHCLRICKTETRYKVDDGVYTRDVKDNAKTDAGNRYVLIDDESERLLDEIKRLNPNGKYVFEINGKRCIGQSFTRKLERTCEALGLNPRSMHKCRKTYITTLINANVPESLIIEQVGHTDIKTSKQYYLYNNKAKAEALSTLSKAISNQCNQ